MEKKPKIVFFIGALVSGGKERRLVELLSFLKRNSNFETLIITTKSMVHYEKFNELGIQNEQIGKHNMFKVYHIMKDLHRVLKSQDPNLVHTWGRMQNFYVLPFKILWKFKLINSQITNAPSGFSFGDKIIDKINFLFSDFIVSNSKAGITSYNPPLNKTLVIPNGMRMERFTNLPAKESIKVKYKIRTEYMVIMVATHTNKKDYQLFFKVAKEVIKLRNDVSFVSAGWFDPESSYFKNNLEIIDNEERIILVGEIRDVEALVNASDIGVLFSTSSYGEGLSNSILEYMALGKPTIATNFGGSKELVSDDETGYLFEPANFSFIVQKINSLLDNPLILKKMGEKSKQIVDQNYTIEIMGQKYQNLYLKLSPSFIAEN
jgi:glycosyltransferase involved in cell wall biosynthesis